MNFKEESAELNNFYYSCLNNIIRRAQDDITGLDAKFLDTCKKNGVTDLSSIIYKKTVDDLEMVNNDFGKFTLLPMGLINSNIPTKFIDKNYAGAQGSYRLNNFYEMFAKDPKYVPFYYPNDSDTPSKDTLSKLCSSYIKHYKESLGEEWSEEDFYNMFSSLKYLSVKYAKDEVTGEVFAVGFFGASIREGAGGKALTNAELYVMPEFRHMGIAKKMVGLTFEQAKNDGIENFDSITYRVTNNDSLAFWQGVGASVSGLIHIEGNIPEMVETISKKTSNQK